MDTIDIKQNIITKKISNGVTLIMEPIDNFSSSSISFFLNKGSRDEMDSEAGYSHFVEHMLFKGTGKENKITLSQKFDEMGGHINAYTSQEEVVIFNRIPSFHLIEVISLMEDMFNNSTFDANELELEKEVIINELNSSFEDPQEKLFEDFYQEFFPKTGLGRPIIGCEERIRDATRDKLFQFYQDTFTGEDLIISIAGNFNPKNVELAVEGMRFRTKKRPHDQRAVMTTRKSGFTKMPSELIHIMSGSVVYEKSPEFYFRLALLSQLLGGSMSSRLFQKVRDDMGLCYTINSQVHSYREETLLAIYLSVLPDKLNKSVDAVSGVLTELLDHGITENELEKAKKQKIGEMLLASDLLHKRMNSNTLYKLYYDNAITKNDAIRIINETTVKDLNRLTDAFFSVPIYTHSLYKKKIGEVTWKL